MAAAPSAVSAALAALAAAPASAGAGVFAAAQRAAADPSRWACGVCGSTSGAWLCLQTGECYCEDEGHVVDYARRARAPLFIQVAHPQAVRNFATGATVRLGARRSDDAATVAAVATIRSRLKGLHSLGGSRWAAARGWDKLRMAVKLFGTPFLTRGAQLERRRRDVQATAAARWQRLELWRAFRTWKVQAAAAVKAGVDTAAPALSAARASACATGAAVEAAIGSKRRMPTAVAEAPGALPNAVAEAFFPLARTAFEQGARQGRTGLRNLGNTCYLNSTVQALAHAPLFRAFLFSLQAQTQRRLADMLTALTTGGDAPDYSSPAAAGGSGIGGSRSSSSSSSLSWSSQQPSAAAAAAVPPPPLEAPRLRRLNSGLQDILELGPNPHAAAALAATAAAAAGPGGAAAWLGAGLAGGGSSSEGAGSLPKSTRSSRREGSGTSPSSSSPAARLRSRLLTSALHEVASRLYGFPFMAVYTPDAFLKAVWIALPQFGGFNQQDAEEFCRALINRLDDECRAAVAVAEPQAPPPARRRGGPPALAAVAEGPPAAVPAPTPVTQMLGGTTVTIVTCSECGTASRREEPFLGPLNLEIPAAFRSRAGGRRGGVGSAAAAGPGASAACCRLQDCLDAAFGGQEALEGDSAYSCDRCGRKVRATLRRRLAALPPVLICHAVRTSWDTGSAKLQAPVAPPLQGLDLTPWLEAEEEAEEGAGTAAGAGAGARPPAKSRRLAAAAVAAAAGGSGAAPLVAPRRQRSGGPASALYDLYASVQHAGAGVRQGHYYCYARNDAEDDFYCFNDARVGVASQKEVAEAQGYLFVFQRRQMMARLPP